MPSTLNRRLLLIPAVIILWGMISTATYFTWIHGADHRDLYPWWAAARLHLFEGKDPYSVETTKQMQLMLYGRLLPPERDQQGFAYPAQLLVILFPLWFIPNVEIATAVWAGLSALLMGASTYTMGKQGGKSLPPWVIGLLLLWSYPLLVIFQGQITGLVLAAFAASIWAYCIGWDGLAGAVIGLAVIKPDLALLPWIALLYLSARERRWKVWISYLGFQSLLFLLSLAVSGWWLPGWIAAVRRYSIYAQSTWVPRTLMEISPLFLLAILVFFIFIFTKLERSPMVIFAASIPLGLLAIPHTLMWNLAVLILPLALCWRGRARWAVAATWAFGWAFMPFPVTWQVQYIVLPCMVILCLWLAYPRPSAVLLSTQQA
jgi:hypothetical protein